MPNPVAFWDNVAVLRPETAAQVLRHPAAIPLMGYSLWIGTQCFIGIFPLGQYLGKWKDKTIGFEVSELSHW